MQKEPKEPKIEKNIKKFKVAFIGDNDWIHMRNLMVLKLTECRTEAEFSEFFEVMLASMFINEKEMNNARKKIGAKLLTKIEKKRIEEIKKDGQM